MDQESFEQAILAVLREVPEQHRMPILAMVQGLVKRHFQYLLCGIMPRSVLEAKVMQATTRFHDGITNPVLQEADFVFHHPIAFHPTNGVFNADADRRDPTIGGFLRRGEFPPTGLFLGLDDGDPGQNESLESHILIETTPRGQGVTRQIRQAFLMHLAFIGITQEANVTGLIDHEEVFDRVAFLLATVILLLVLGILRAVDRSLRTIMPKRGDVGTAFVCVVARRVANSSAVRAGSKSWCANARFNTVWRR